MNRANKERLGVMDRAALLERIEPGLSWAREALGAKDELRAREVVQACVALLTMYRKAAYGDYQPALALEALYSALARREDVVAEFESVPASVGDPAQVEAVAQAFLEGIRLEGDARLVVELFHEDEVTELAVNLDGPGRFDDPVWLAGVVAVLREELGDRWTYATRGGRIDTTANGYSLRVTGVRKPPAPVEDVEALIHTLRSGGLRDAIETALHVIDDAPQTAPGDVKALVEAVVAEEQGSLERRRVAIELMVAPDLPAIVVKRGRLRVFFQSLLRMAMGTLGEGGTVVLLCDYDPTDRVVGVVATLSGRGAAFEERGYGASMRRAIVDGHGGTLEIERGDELTVIASIPDMVGRRIDPWIPGWGVFSARSQQMLRLLKSGGQTPPEEFLLEGILEEELERWLLPRLGEALAVNVASEIVVKDAGQEGASVERLKKAVEQVKKGKAKKEIAQPGYAAELLWAVRNDARGRAAFGAEGLAVEEVEALARALWAKPAGHVEALRAIAKAGDRMARR